MYNLALTSIAYMLCCLDFPDDQHQRRPQGAGLPFHLTQVVFEYHDCGCLIDHAAALGAGDVGVEQPLLRIRGAVTLIEILNGYAQTPRETFAEVPDLFRLRPDISFGRERHPYHNQRRVQLRQQRLNLFEIGFHAASPADRAHGMGRDHHLVRGRDSNGGITNVKSYDSGHGF